MTIFCTSTCILYKLVYKYRHIYSGIVAFSNIYLMYNRTHIHTIFYTQYIFIHTLFYIPYTVYKLTWNLLFRAAAFKNDSAMIE